MHFRGISTLFETKSSLQSLHILSTKWKIGDAVIVASEQKLKKEGSVNKKFVVVPCLLSKSKYQFRFRFGSKICL